MTQCRLCDFWRPSNELEVGHGYCKCHAPRPMPKTWWRVVIDYARRHHIEVDSEIQWPVTHANRACGEGVEKAKK